MAPTRTANRKKNRLTAMVLFTVAGGMVGLAFAAVPLYQLFCQVTGFGGTPKIAARAPAQPTGAAAEKTITVRFDANGGARMGWRFEPAQRQMTVRVGDEALAYFTARNVSDAAVTGTATFNVTPYKAARYFGKIDCFCFSEQRLAVGEEASMPVSFVVDPAIFTDPRTRDVRTITLSYTFFRVAGPANVLAGARQDRPGDG